MPSTIKKGSHVLVVEGPHNGEEGHVKELFRAYDAGTRTTHKLVVIEQGNPHMVTTFSTQLAFVREI